MAPPAAGGGKCLSLSPLSLSLFSLLPSLPRAWSKCWSCAPHEMPDGPPPSPSPATITIARYHRESLVPVRPRAPTPSTVPAVALAVSLHRDLTASSALLPRRRTPLEAPSSRSALPAPFRVVTSTAAFLLFDLERRLRSTVVGETRPLGVSSSFAFASRRQTRAANRKGSSRNLSVTDGGRRRGFNIFLSVGRLMFPPVSLLLSSSWSRETSRGKRSRGDRVLVNELRCTLISGRFDASFAR